MEIVFDVVGVTPGGDMMVKVADVEEAISELLRGHEEQISAYRSLLEASMSRENRGEATISAIDGLLGELNGYEANGVDVFNAIAQAVDDFNNRRE